MTDARSLLKASIAEQVVPLLREHGYKGSFPTWRKSSDAGDWAIVNLQSSSASTRDLVKCTLNVAVAPKPWLQWNAELYGPALLAKPREHDGLYRDRPGPSRLFGMGRAADALPTLDRLLDPEAMLAAARAGSIGMFHGRDKNPLLIAKAEAVLLAEAGPSGELERALAAHRSADKYGEVSDRLEAWVRRQRGGE